MFVAIIQRPNGFATYLTYDIEEDRFDETIDFQIAKSLAFIGEEEALEAVKDAKAIGVLPRYTRVDVLRAGVVEIIKEGLL